MRLFVKTVIVAAGLIGCGESTAATTTPSGAGGAGSGGEDAVGGGGGSATSSSSSTSSGGGSPSPLPPLAFWKIENNDLQAVSVAATNDDGTLTLHPSAPWSTNDMNHVVPAVAETRSLLLDEPRRRLFAVNFYSITTFAVGDDGALTSLGSAPAAADTRLLGGVLTPAGDRLIAVDEDDARLAVYEVDSDGMLLEPVVIPIAHRGNTPVISEDGQWLYMISEPFSEPGLQVYALGEDGGLTEAAFSPVAGSGRALHRAAGRLFALDDDFDELWIYDLDATSGVPTPTTGSPFSVGDSRGLAVREDGSRLFVGGSSYLFVYDLDAAATTLTPVAGSPFPILALPSVLRFTADGSHLLMATNSGHELFSFSIDPSGAPTQVDHVRHPELDLKPGYASSGLVITP